MIDAKSIDFLALSFDDTILVDIQNQLNLSDIELEGFLEAASESHHQLIINWGDVIDEEGNNDVRYVPVQFSTNKSVLNFNENFVCHFFVADRTVYAYHIYDQWGDKNMSLAQAYQQFFQKLEILIKHGWRNYYFPDEVRYAASCEHRLLQEQQLTILPNQLILSFEQFCHCLESENQWINIHLYLDDVHMSIVYTDTFSALMEINKINHFFSYHRQREYKATSRIDSFENYRLEAIRLRQIAEQEAKEQGYEIDENYVDPFIS